MRGYMNRITGEVITEGNFWSRVVTGAINARDFESVWAKCESDPEQAAKSEQSEPLYVNRFTGEVMTLDEAMNYVNERYRTFKKMFVLESKSGNISVNDLYFNKESRLVGTFDDFYDGNITDNKFFDLLDNLIPLENMPEFANVDCALFVNAENTIVLAYNVFIKNLRSSHWKLYVDDTDEAFWFEMNEIHGANLTLYELYNKMYECGYVHTHTPHIDIGSEHKMTEAWELVEKLQDAYDMLSKYNLV